MSEFNQNKYIQDWKKKNYKTFKVDLKKEEKEHLDFLLKENALKGADFVRLSIKALEEGKIKKEEKDT